MYHLFKDILDNCLGEVPHIGAVVNYPHTFVHIVYVKNSIVNNRIETF